MGLRILDDALVMVKAAYGVALVIERRDRDLARQLRRSNSSVVLNIGEGTHSDRGNRVMRYKNAMASASEVRTTLKVAEAVGFIVVDAELDDRLDKIVATMWRLTH